MPVKHLDTQVTMKTHLSQSTGTGAFDGQHGISPAISSIMADVDISSAIAGMRSLRWCPRHDRPGNRRHYKTRDHQDREQPTDGEIAVHGIKLSQTSGDKKATSLKVMELYLSCIDRYQVANKFDVRKGSKRGDSTMFELLPLLWDSYGQAPDLDGVGDVPRAIAGSKRGAH